MVKKAKTCLQTGGHKEKEKLWKFAFVVLRGWGPFHAKGIVVNAKAGP